ncbi:MAG: 6-carboxytetrahydropterin synthase [Euryarchaeota archaeon]|nr:6-carboxytetrahydropterin synthase [Euryarchaeota archaeon]MBV1728815.1 6-carboxytetrahydropterin synthase [Methanobacterium sp.]MBU4547425.1 6-carboxytetrahydropterin synthase [Euryarchaeota archaeon]MBU4608412.1 6-carboxytetrahydropterin synthase [Euryarchaeota archaeon]MBV1755476.1 6-carboxytetrahydropterin synthase [Methanobacterium sp.]
MKIIINGIHANLRFSAAHMIPEHESCGCIHGHSYHVDVQLEGQRSGKFGFVVDFKEVKNIVRTICKKLDHKVLIPLESSLIEFKSLKNSVEFSIDGKEYKLPLQDCVLLPLPSTSAEDLSIYFVDKLWEELEKKGAGVSVVQICVNEGIGQGAFYSRDRN